MDSQVFAFGQARTKLGPKNPVGALELLCSLQTTIFDFKFEVIASRY